MPMYGLLWRANRSMANNRRNAKRLPSARMAPAALSQFRNAPVQRGLDVSVVIPASQRLGTVGSGMELPALRREGRHYFLNERMCVMSALISSSFSLSP